MQKTKHNDQEIVARIKEGQINYYSYLVEKYMPNIIRLVRAKLFNKLDVDDVVQNTFVSFYKSIRYFDVNKPISPYLYKIALNELKMYYRSHKKTLLLDEDSEMYSYENMYIEEDYSSLIKSLTQEQQIILELLQQGYSYEEIANRVNKPINTLRTIIRRTRIQLKKKYEET